MLTPRSLSTCANVAHDHTHHTIVNSAGEPFHVVVFGGTDASVPDGSPTLPVVVCVHGAGMSASSFYTIAPFLVSDYSMFDQLQTEWIASPMSTPSMRSRSSSTCTDDRGERDHGAHAAADQDEVHNSANGNGSVTVSRSSSSSGTTPPLQPLPSGIVRSGPPLPAATVKPAIVHPALAATRGLTRPAISIAAKMPGTPPRMPSPMHSTPPIPHPVVPRALSPVQHGTRSTSPPALFPDQLSDREDGSYRLRVVSIDLRCHGESTYAGGECNLTIEQMATDFLDVFHGIRTELFPKTPRFYLLGHSLGGAVISKALAAHKELRTAVGGVILVDIVEGTAKLSLKYMDEFLAKRPLVFDSVNDAVRWFVAHGGMRTTSSASLSVPPLLKQREDGKWVWRSDLSAMRPVWDGWFHGMDENFVHLPVPKMLCLATTDRLDKDLTVAQMQGKFQMEIMGNSAGHYVMDDAPSLLSIKIKRFVRRIETLTIKLALKK